MRVFKVQVPFSRSAVTRSCGMGHEEERIPYLDCEMAMPPPVQNGEEGLQHL